jgi:hypothetical protein
VYGCPLDEAKDRTPYAEFLGWVEHFRRKLKRRSKDEYYLAAVRYEIYLMRYQLGLSGFFGGKLEKAKFTDFLLSDEESGGDRSAAMSRVGGRASFAPGDDGYLAASKGAWLAKVGAI